MHCDRCHKPVSDDAPIWRISIGYSGPPQSAVQSWCNACANRRIELFNRLPPNTKNGPKIGASDCSRHMPTTGTLRTPASIVGAR